jgi:hypothetical protein
MLSGAIGRRLAMLYVLNLPPPLAARQFHFLLFWWVFGIILGVVEVVWTLD